MTLANQTNEKQPLLGNRNLAQRPFARKVAQANPRLWRLYLAACERERATTIEALQEIRRAASSLHSVESLGELDMAALSDICASLHHAQHALESIIGAERRP